MIEGRRPEKPRDASSIGFSDLLWDFVQRCWDGDMKLRPRVSEVVECLGTVAADWDGSMPPCAVVETVVSDSEEKMSDTEKYCEFDILILPRYSSSGNGTGKIFTPSLDAAPESSTESQATPGPFSNQSASSTEWSEPPQEETQEVVAKLFDEPQSESQVSVQSLSERPMPELPTSIQSGSMEHCESKIPVLLDTTHRAMV